MMKKLGLVVAAVVMLATVAMAQEWNFGKYGIGIGFGQKYFNLTTTLPIVRMNGSYTIQNLIGNNPPQTTPYFRDVALDTLKQIATNAIPIDVTWRPIEALGVRLGTNVIMGSEVFAKDNATISETEVDSAGNFVFTTVTSGTRMTEVTGKVSGFPFSLSLGPTFKFGDRVIVQPELGMAYYTLSMKGDKGTYSSSITNTTFRHDTTTGRDTTWSSVLNSDSYSGKMPDVKTSGIGTFWGFDTQVLVYSKVTLRALYQRGSAHLKSKYTDEITRYYPGGGRWWRVGDKTTYERTLFDTQVSTETYSLGLVYNF
jgi:hypothetical protein